MDQLHWGSEPGRAAAYGAPAHHRAAHIHGQRPRLWRSVEDVLQMGKELTPGDALSYPTLRAALERAHGHRISRDQDGSTVLHAAQSRL